MSKHTEGPWSYEVRPNHAGPAPRYVITSETTDRIAVISERGGAASPEANARLIASAPDLLEALELCADWLSTEFETDIEGDNFHSREILDPARAAIAKAKGEDND